VFAAQDRRSDRPAKRDHLSAFLDQVADLKTREDYEALQIGVEILAGYYSGSSGL